MKTFCLTILVLCTSLIPEVAVSQHTRQTDLTLNQEKKDSLYSLRTDYPTTGMVLKIHPENTFDGAYLIVEGDTLHLQNDEENNEDPEFRFSNLLTFPRPISGFFFYPGSIKSEVQFVFIDARMPEKPAAEEAVKKKSPVACSEPPMIDQSEWRIDLPEPDYTRIPNTVHNLIIHHTAGSNTDDNYFQVIRNIYIYHTEVRGWSDIGYNYVIAQDGTIFKARDPGDLEQDNVLGAHFCGANTGTMGISMMGTYTDIVPPDTALQSLVKLLNWKAGKDSLDPQGYNPHPLNPSLAIVAGHRDGCATECPGQKLYEELVNIRDSTQFAFDACAFVANPPLAVEHSLQNISILQDHKELIIRGTEILSVDIFNVFGQRMEYHVVPGGADEKRFVLQVPISCNVIVRITHKQGSFSRMLFIP